MTRRRGSSSGSSTTSTAWPARWSGRRAPTRRCGCTTPRSWRGSATGKSRAKSITVFTNAFVIDCTGAEPVEGAAVVVEDDTIKDVARHGMVGSIADGVDEVRKAAREQLRRDVDQIKIMASGGAMSPSDELDTTQYTVAEMRAAVEEAQAVGKYVLSHAYSDSAVRRAIEAGVRSIEHGNLIREGAAKAIKEAGAFIVPTMVTYEAIYREGKRYGIGDHQIQKIDLARQQSVQGLTYAYRAGCKIGSGSDLLGDMMVQRAVEFELKAQVMTPMEVLLSATRVNAELFRMSDRIGTVEAGKYADLVVVTGDPLRNLRVFQTQDNLKVIMKGGRLYKRTL